MKKNKKFGLLIAIALLVAIGVGGLKLTQPSYALRMDVNPSIEIVSNRLNKVVEVNPLNDDARKMLKDYKIANKDLKNTIEDLADLMVLRGYISGGKDNLVMITVDDDHVNKDMVNKLNEAIAAYLENKQIEATIVNQSIPKENASEKTSKEIVVERISALNDDLDFEKMADMTLRELIAYAESNNISPQSLFNRVVRTAKHNGNIGNKVNVHKDDDDKKGSKTIIGEAKAREIALELVNGEIVEFKLDDYDDDDYDAEYEIKIIANGYKYEIEIDAYTGKVLEFEKDGKVTTNNRKIIGEARAREIALGLVNGKIVEFELDDYEDDDDDAKYEIEIIANGYEYEIEIDAYTGKVLEFEKDD